MSCAARRPGRYSTQGQRRPGDCRRHTQDLRRQGKFRRCFTISRAWTGIPHFGAPAGLSRRKGEEFGRLALHFGLNRNARPKDILERVISASASSPIPPRLVDTGPCKENIWRAEDVDLTRFPVPRLHAADGGLYFATYGFHVVGTPDGSWVNWSVARAMLHGKNSLVGPVMSRQHIGMIREMWKRDGKATPWALALGAPPAAIAVAGMPLPEGVSEGGYVGAMTGEAIDVVKTETNNLCVPANAEIVLEGDDQRLGKGNGGSHG